VDPLSAELALTEAAAAKRRVKSAARAAMAVPLRLLAVAWIVLCPTVLVVGRNHLAPFVGLSLLAVTAVAWRRYERIAGMTGIRARLWPWIAVALAALAGGAAASRGGTQYGLPWLNEGGPFVMNALALACLSWLLRSRALAVGTAVMAAISLAVAATMNGDPAVATQLAAYATVLLVVSEMMSR
jgi:hypothetical protein